MLDMNRRAVIYALLNKPRTQKEIQIRLGMSRSGTLGILRRMQRDGLVVPVERIGLNQIWERESRDEDFDLSVSCAQSVV